MAGENKVGRPRAITDTERAEIIAQLLKGFGFQESCALSGVSYQTFLKERERCPKFYRKAKQAAKLGKVLRAQKARSVVHGAIDEGDWKAAAWWLERQCPDEFAKSRQQPAVNITNTQVVAIAGNDPIFLPPEQRGAILVSIMGNAADASNEGAKESVAGSAAGAIGNGIAVGADAANAAKVLPAPTVAETGGHAGNGRH